MTDFFVSYSGKDQPWAEWIAWHLDAAGFTTLIQVWDFKSGGVFTIDMHRALEQCSRIIAVLSPDYLASDFCKTEWLAAFEEDPTGTAQRLIPVRIADFKPTGLLAGRTYIDLVDKSETEAAAFLLKRLKQLNQGRAKPAAAPGFPSRFQMGTVKPAPLFPGLPPNNLPRLHFFFGRDKELAKIADALSPKTRTWGALIDGPGGIGKTSLAIRAAELAPAGQFQRILFLSSKERRMTGDGERKLSDFVVPGYLDMLNEIARLLKQPELAKQPEADRARLVIDALEPTQALLILDNLESLPKCQQNQLFEFLSQLPQGCKAIATSRRRTDVDARIIRLEKLDQQAALALLAELAADRPLLEKASEADRIHLYEETGGSPLLLRWIAGQLGKSRCRTISSSLEFLRNAPGDNDPLEFIFGDLLETFTESETKILAALTYFTTLMKVTFIAEVGGISGTAAQTALGDLAGRALVVPDKEEENFALVPMVADFLRKKRPEAVQSTGIRLADRAYALILENGYDKHERFPILDAAWPMVRPALRLFLAGPHQRFQTVCNALRSFLEATSRWDELSLLLQKSETEYDEIPKLFQIGRPLNLSEPELFQGRSDILNKIKGSFHGGIQREPYFIDGIRRAGKTSILHFLPSFLPDHLAPVLVNVDEFGLSGPIDSASVLRDLCLAVADQTRAMGDVPQPPSLSEFQVHAPAAFAAFLASLEKALPGRVPFLMIDEFQDLLLAISRTGTGRNRDTLVLDLLRSGLESGRLNAIFTGCVRFDRLSNIMNHRIFGSMSPLRVSFLPAESVGKILRAGMGPSLVLAPETVQAICDLTGGYPWLVQCYGSLLVDLANQERSVVVTPEDADIVTQEVLSNDGLFSFWWPTDQLGADEERFIDILFRKFPDWFPSLQEFLGEVHNRDHSTFRRAFEKLRACEVLDSTPTQLRFRGSVLREWLKRQIDPDGHVRVRVAPTPPNDPGHAGIFIDHENLIRTMDEIQARRGSPPTDRLEWFKAVLGRLVEEANRRIGDLKYKVTVAFWSRPHEAMLLPAYFHFGFDPKQPAEVKLENAVDFTVADEVRRAREGSLRENSSLGRAVVVSGEGDLSHAVRALVNDGVAVQVWGGSRETCAKYVEIVGSENVVFLDDVCGF
jgi:hypothetical protein